MTSGDHVRDNHMRLPKRLVGLEELAYNLWWSWHPEARMLFKQINQEAWRESNHNPVRMLREIPYRYLEAASENPAYLRDYDVVLKRLRSYMKQKRGWFGEHYDKKPFTIAYFSAEYGLHHSLPFYAGGLGFLAGDHLKECSDMNVPLVGIGFMYSRGYLHQHIRADGWQEEITLTVNRDCAPITRLRDESGRDLVIGVPDIDPPVSVAVWRVDVGRVPLYLLDTDIPENDPYIRGISSHLYTGNRKMRLLQQIVLGIGGRHILKQLGVRFSGIHLNEGHSAFALLELAREYVEEEGIPVGEALEKIRGLTVFTTHTPVPAGHDIYDPDLVEQHLGHYIAKLGMTREDFLALGSSPDNPGNGFNMTALALRLSHYHNAVSKKHAEVTRGMWSGCWPGLQEDEIPIDAITNGVHLPTWLNPRMEMLLNAYFARICPHWQQKHDNTEIWAVVDDIPDEVLWKQHTWLKMKLFNRIREYKRRKWAEGLEKPENLVAEGTLLNPSVLTIGFARRFSSYKRADLLLYDVERLAEILNNTWHPVQIIFAGKAHPDDTEGKKILQRIYQLAMRPEMAGRIAVIENYGEQIAQYMVHGVDLWLNTPLPPLEASGTSGMKAAMNGVINCSILDGWWCEGYNGRNGWAFGGGGRRGDRTADDAQALYRLLEDEIAPLYYNRAMNGIPHGWIAMMKESMKSIPPLFSARRMVKEYVHTYYPRMVACAEENLCRTG
ncbi:MAG: alpha-glucan family phosphorylase [Methanocalculus sp. MSAO_Arc1]|nr:MAG: alpha-glucan family phosphorylase [Methanocalculus sp. MSAO_Arc1]